MADNVAITAGSGTTIAADDVGSGVLHQRVKVTWGVDGTGTDTSATNPLPASPRSTTGTAANVASSATSVTLQASNAARLGLTIYNDSTQVLYVKFGATASATSFLVKIAAGGYFEAPFGYTGIVDGIWASANGNARVVELT